MIRKRILCLLAVLLLISLCGCQKGQKLGLCLCTANDSALAAYYQALEEDLTAAGYRVSVVNAAGDQATQAEQIAAFAEDHYDILVIEPVMTSAGAELVEQVKAAGIPTVFVNREPDAQALELWDKVSFVGCDADQAGILQGQIILQTPDKGDINGDGVVSYMVISGPADHKDAQSRTQTCTQKLTDAGMEISKISSGTGDWTRESGLRLCEYALAKYGKDLEVIFCNNDDMALGALEAIHSGGRTVGQDIYLVGIDATQQALQQVLDGKLTGTVSTNIKAQTEKICAVAQALLSDTPVEKRYYVNYTAVAQENVETFLSE